MPDQTFLPSLTDNKGPHDKQSAKMGAKKKSLRQRKVNGDRMFVSFPEVAKTIRVAKKTVKSFAVNSSSSKTSSLKTEDMSNRKKTGENLSDLNKDQLRKQLRLPSLVLTPTSERRMSEERWSNALGLRDRYEIPRGVLNKLTDEIFKIDQQLREEAKIRQIREQRMAFDVKKRKLLSSELNDFERTSRPGFSYFPCIGKSVVDLPASNELFWIEDREQERLLREEKMIQRKMREFKNRHSHFKPRV